MTYSQRIYGTGPAVAENKTDTQVDGKLFNLAWRKATDPAAQRVNRYDKAKRSAAAWAWVDRYVENSRHRGALDQLQ